ncbi:DUF167 family protein [Devosia chinhatensis]|uniref:DUF167 family protein n=1 Tax=Devosia chinhatensis TaxID=429727 RepID=UPI000A9F767E
MRVTPNAGRDTIGPAETRADGSSVLRVRLVAVPDKGQANAAVIALIAKALGVPKSAVSLASGQTSRIKVLSVSGDVAQLCGKAHALESSAM